ncbi:MAG: hypothetical protein DRJ49_05115, partial [Thermoprotei archaeon]
MSGELKEGFTYRTIIAILFSAFIMMPSLLWVYLTTGQPIGGIAAAYATMLIFGELGLLFLSPLTVHELVTIRWGASMAATYGAGILFNIYFRKSPIAKQYGVADKIPIWAVPPETSEAFIERTIWHPDWMLPLIIGYTGTIISLISAISLSLIARELFIEVESLPFPTGAVAAEIAESLSGLRPEKYRVFAVSTLFSALFEMLRTLIPAVTLILFGIRAIVLPSIHFDVTNVMEWILPGSTTGITANVMIVALGLILPEQVILWSLISSFITYLVLPPILIKTGVDYPYTRGMPMIVPGTLEGAWYKPMLRFWLSYGVGFIFAAAIVPFILNLRQMTTAIKTFFSLSGSRAKSLGLLSGKTTLLLFLVPQIIASILAYLLTPLGLPFLLAILTINFGLTLFDTIVSGRSVGLTGGATTIPYANYVLLMTTTRPEQIEVWFNPFLINPGVTAADICIGYKAAQLTNTKPVSIVKAHLMGIFSTQLVGLLIASLLWHLYDVPSRLLPAPSFPVDTVIRCLFITRRFGEYLKWPQVLSTSILGSMFLIVPRFIRGLAPIVGLPALFGIIWGIMDMPSNVVGVFLGYIFKKLLERKMG